MKSIYLIIAILAIAGPVPSQVIDFSVPVDMDYDGLELEQVLEDIHQRYALKFSYSKDIIPVDQPIFIQVSETPLKGALDELFLQTKVIYGFIGHQIVLSVDPEKVPITPYVPGGMEASTDRHSSPIVISREDIRPVNGIPQLRYHSIEYGDVNERMVIHGMKADPGEWQMQKAERESSTPKVQLSLVPGLQLISDDNEQTPVNISFNILWGVNDALDGAEFGIFANSILNDMEGIQIAGFANTVGGKVKGSQLSGFANVTEGKVLGLQAAGFGNYSKEFRGAQLAGGVNINTGKAIGLQGAGIANWNSYGGDLVQIAGVFNGTTDQSKGQIAGIANFSEDTDFQIAGILNVARHMKGPQIGLINICDTTESVSIGLLSIVRKGYNRVEFSGNEALHGNFKMRLGTRGFYNILHIGTRFDEETWAFGYGIGTSIRTGPKLSMQLELLSMHVSERESFTNELNLLNQFSLNWELLLGRKTALVFGPTFNVAVSQRFDTESGIYGMQIAPYTMFNKTYDQDHPHKTPTNVKGWIGFNAGLRF